MTDPSEAPTQKLPRPKRVPITKPGLFPVVGGSLALFFVIVALLAFQMRTGADPALGAGEPQLVAAAKPPQPRRVLIRRVIVTRIVEHRPARRRWAAQAPVTPAAAPALAAAAPAPAAPAPPAPAPLTTRSS